MGCMCDVDHVGRPCSNTELAEVHAQKGISAVKKRRSFRLSSSPHCRLEDETLLQLLIWMIPRIL